MTFLPLITTLLPGVAGLSIGLFGRRAGERIAYLAVAATWAAFALSVWLLWEVVGVGPVQAQVGFLGGGGALLRLEVDRLTAVMMVLITGVSAVVHCFSVRYMQGERRYSRFFMLLGIITSILLLLVGSANLLMLFAFWHALTWLLYLLLAYNERSLAAQRGARKTLIIHLMGDVAFLGGLLTAWRVAGTLEFGALAVRLEQAAPLSLGDIHLSAASTVAVLIFIAAMAKSAQFPLHLWLPVTMDTPTPVSALMHAGIVNAGGFLLNRLAPLYVLTPEVLHLVFVVGGLTLVLGATMMLVQTDIKKKLGYSTMAQMGYMIMECGLGAFALAIFHLIAHGLFKASHFLNAGSVIRKTRHDPRHPALGAPARPEFSGVAWGSGLMLTLILPLVILLVAHGLIRIPLLESQGMTIFLFFSWVTASQVLFSLYRLRPEASWKVVPAMGLAVLIVVLTYLWGGARFTALLYPDPALVDRFFVAAALPGALFELLVAGATALIVLGWVLLYAEARGRLVVPSWISAVQSPVYMALTNGLYLDVAVRQLLEKLGRHTPMRPMATLRDDDAASHGIEDR